MTDTTMHVYEFNDGYDFVVASSEADAVAVFREFYGSGTTPILGEQEIADQIETVLQVDDAEPFKVWWHPIRDSLAEPGENGAEAISKTASEWAAHVGRGWFCSTEF